jgi:hypothetical protein
MRSPLAHERRRAVSTYLETFVLIAVAAGGSAAIYSALGGYASSATGASFAVSGATIRQGTYAAVERISVANTGPVQLTSITVATGISSTPQYCATLVDASSGTAVGFASPPPQCGAGTAADPASITLTPSPAVAPGESVVLSVVIYSPGEFQAGAQYYIVVSASGAAEQVSAVAVPG